MQEYMKPSITNLWLKILILQTSGKIASVEGYHYIFYDLKCKA